MPTKDLSTEQLFEDLLQKPIHEQNNLLANLTNSGIDAVTDHLIKKMETRTRSERIALLRRLAHMAKHPAQDDEPTLPLTEQDAHLLVADLTQLSAAAQARYIQRLNTAELRAVIRITSAMVEDTGCLQTCAEQLLNGLLSE